jgi:DNA-binding FadR family transcriptional regulator
MYFVDQYCYFVDNIREIIDPKAFRYFCKGITPEDIENLDDVVVESNYLDIKSEFLGTNQFRVRLMPETKALINKKYNRRVAGILLIMFAQNN